MTPDPDFESLLNERRAAAEKSLRPITTEELQALAAKLFPDESHPWGPLFSKFITEHPLEEAYQGEVEDGISFVFYPITRRGIWYQFADGVKGMGPMGERGLTALTEIVAERA